MTVVPAGRYQMGSPSTETDHQTLEAPQHEVTISRPFGVGKFPVTRDEYARFVTETKRESGPICMSFNGKSIAPTPGLSWRKPGFEQAGDHPAVCIGWEDATAYVRWLSAKTGKPYRLLSEAEWEYAARAGTTQARWWGDAASHDKMNYGADKCCVGVAVGRDRWMFTSPKGAFEANAFGLHDMLGNVFEWTSDCWNTSYDGAPSDGASWQAGDCSKHVRRGGSWHGDPRVVRSAFRNGFVNDFRSGSGGFRVAVDLQGPP